MWTLSMYTVDGAVVRLTYRTIEEAVAAGDEFLAINDDALYAEVFG